MDMHSAFIISCVAAMACSAGADWSPQVIDSYSETRGLRDIGFDINEDGLCGIASVADDGFNVTYHWQEGSRGNASWHKEQVTHFRRPRFLALRFLSLAYDSKGGCGIAASYTGVSAQSKPETKAFYLHKPKGGAWAIEEEPFFCHVFERTALVSTINCLHVKLGFDEQCRPVAGIINQRYEIDEQRREWFHASVHYAVKSGAWTVFDIDNRYSQPYGYPEIEYATLGMNAIDLAVNPNDSEFPYVIVYKDAVFILNAEKAKSGHVQIVCVRASPGGQFEARAIPGTEDLKFQELHVALDETDDYNPRVACSAYNHIYYIAKSNTGWGPLTDVTPGNSFKSLVIGGLAIPHGIPYISFFATGKDGAGTGELYCINGPIWPKTPKDWTRVAADTDASWKWPIVADPKAPVAPKCIVAYQVPKGNGDMTGKSIMAGGGNPEAAGK